MREFKPPRSFMIEPDRPRVFLGGSIEMGTAVNWQSVVVQGLYGHPVDILNPRRDDWDASWNQSIDSPEFFGQVNWELDAMEASDVIVLNFVAGTMSPISLLELGLFARSKKLIVCCPHDFWRKGNVDVACRKYGIPQVASLSELIGVLRNRFPE